jgi:hypothetical protein
VREETRHEHGALAVTSPIDGVEIFVNGQRVGEARRGRVLVIDHLVSGPYRVEARRTGYRAWTREIHVEADHRAEIVVDLERVLGGQ